MWSNKRGNIALITAMMMIPLTFALGMAYDFTMAQSRKDQINGMADVASLGGVTPTMMLGSASASAAQAKTLFEGQIATVKGVTYSVSNITTTGTDNTAVTPIVRTVTVSYTAASQNIFATLLGMNTFPISGSSTATSSVSPNIDFYLLLDTSPSMEIGASQTDINTMVSNTSSQSGCAFACHETNPSADGLGNPGGEDNYALARNLNVTLRIDLVEQAAYNLMSTARSTATQNQAQYRAALLTTNYPGLATGASSDSLYLLKALTATLTTGDGSNSAQQAATGIQSMEVYDNNCLTSSDCNSDQDTTLDGDIQCLYSGCSNYANGMPAPGNGTNNQGDTPQEVLFIVSDGVNDYAGSGGRTMNAVNSATDSNGKTWCDDIKAKGIRIAFLYTTYYPLPTNSFYVSNVEPFQPNIATAAQNCASPGLFYQVATGGDISAALTNLFQRAVATARLTQ